MRIFVKVLKGSECEVTVSPTSCVQDVKLQLQTQVSIPVDQQKLIFQGKALSDEKPLSHYKITDGSKLFLMLRKPGSSVTPASCSTPIQTPLKSPDTSSPMVVEAQEELFTVKDDPTEFWKKLSAFLKRHFTEKDASRVLKEFKLDFDRGLKSMSLDDIERLAARRLNSSQGYFPSNKT